MARMDDLERQHRSKQAERLLAQSIKKSMMTTMIHAISEWENIFGHLCNIDEEDESKLTPEQKYIDELFEKWRKSVLDRGNDQGRRLVNLLNGYEIQLKQVKIPVKGKDLHNEQN